MDLWVGDHGSKPGERRAAPRFSCGGRATIYRLPMDGTAIPASLRNLSVGGICLDLAHDVEPGTRTELAVRINASSFRASALVRERGEGSGTSLVFVKLSAGGKEVLADLLARMAQIQALSRKLRAPRVDEGTKQMLARKCCVPRLGLEPLTPALRIIEPEIAVESEICRIETEWIEIDVFG